MPNVDFIISYESGKASQDEIIENFQEMINDGSVWHFKVLMAKWHNFY